MRKGLAVIVGLVVLGMLALIAVPLVVVAAVAGGSGGGGAGPSSVPGIDATLLDAYNRAAAQAGVVAPGCTGMRWSVLAGIGQIESGQAQGRTISLAGDVTPPIIGPALDGSGTGGNTTPVLDTDHGQWDNDRVYDHAVGALQFLPSTWQVLGQDGNGDGIKNPHNVYDDALAAVAHLCRSAGAGPIDLGDPAQLAAAIYGYNHSQSYVDEVLGWINTFDSLPSTVGPTSGPVVGGTGRGAAVIAAGEHWLGTPYAWGGGNATGPTHGISYGAGTIGFDCSGLTLYAYAQVGISLPHSSQTQFTMGTRIPRTAGVAALQPGDLVFFAVDPVASIDVHHVGIYVGGGQMLDAPHTGSVVRIEPLWLDSYTGGVRFP